MFKKAIACVLSTVMCTSVLLSDAPLGSKTTQPAGEQIPAAEQKDSADGLQGSNAFARYLQQQTAAQNAKPAGKNMQAAAAETTYSVTNLEFDAETGTVRAVSSQSFAQKLVVSFIDEDNPANVYKLEADVEAGEYILTELDADLSALPAFFTVSAQLVNRLGQPLCDAFTLNRYTHEMQEILAKNTTDFAPEQVVNFDDDESTNFIVLSDETVRADSDADSNVLVSADYDNNIYTFDHIGEDIRTLESGKYFFSMPSQDDLIAIQVTDVTIEGDSATVSGSDSLDGMFDFIKIEEEETLPLWISSTDDETPQIAASLDGESAEEHTSEKQFLANAAGQDEALEFINQDAKAHEGSLSFNPSSLNQETDHGLITTKTALNGKLTWKYNFYLNAASFFTKDWYACAYFVVTYDFTASFQAKSNNVSLNNGTGSTPEPPFEQSNYPLDGFSVSAGTTVPVTTGVTGLTIELHPKVSVYATLDCDVSYQKQVTRGFYFDTRSGITLIRSESEDNGVKMKLCGELHVLFELTVTVDYLYLIDAYVTLRLELHPQCKVDQVKKESPLGGGHPSSGHIVFACPGASGDTQHVCDYCLSGSLYATLSACAGVESHIPFLKYQGSSDFGSLTTVLGPFYCSAIKTGAVYKLDAGMGSCPHYANRTTVTVKLTGEVTDSTATLKMGNDSYRVGAGNKVFYTVPGQTVNYELTVSNPNAIIKYPNDKKYYTMPEGSTLSLEIIVIFPPTTTSSTLSPPPPPTTKSKPITTKSTTKTNTEPSKTTATHTFTFSWSHKTTTTKPVTTATTAKPVSGSTGASTTTTTTTVPVKEDVEIPAGDYIIESVQLGPYIYANLYNNGVVNAWGCGDMYETFTKSPFSNVNKIKYIYLMDTPMKGVVLSDKPESEMTEAEKTLQAALKDGVINSIGRNVFNSAAALKRVDLISLKDDKTYQPSRITIISEKAFSGCSALEYIWDRSVGSAPKTVDLPQNLVTVGANAYNGCASAKFGKLTFPKTVQVIGESAFTNCPGITEVTVPGDSQPVLNPYIFSGCTGIRKAVLGDGIQSIGYFLFANCINLEDLTIPCFGLDPAEPGNRLYEYFNSGGGEGLYRVYYKPTPASAYTGYLPEKLTSVTVTGGTVIPPYFFQSVANLEHVSYPDNITEIGAYAFDGCEKLEQIRLPDTLTTIGGYACRGCKAAAFGDLTFPKSIQLIGDSAFSGCLGITAVTVPGDSQPVLEPNIFSGCTGIRKAVLGDGIQSIGYFLFANCINMESLTVPCFGLDPAEPGNRLYEYFNAGGGEGLYRVYYKPTPASAYTGYLPEKLTSVTVTGGTVIPPYFFQDVANLEHVSYPDNITEIGAYAFDGCEKLEQIRLPDTLTTIGGYACRGCKTAAFGDLTFPKSIQLIGDSAFSGCLGITAVTVQGDSQPVLEGSIFSGCTNLRRVVLGDGIQSMSSFIFNSCISLADLTIPYCGFSENEIGNSLFEWFNMNDAEGMYRVYYRSTVMSAFSGYVPDALKKVTVTGGVSVPATFFRNMEKLESITLHAEIGSVQDCAFQNCNGLAEAYLIGEDADWENVEIIENGNEPLLALVRKGKPLVILSDPGDVTAKPGETVSFHVAAAGKYAKSYLWQSSGDGGSTWGKAGSTDDTLTFAAEDRFSGRLYRCVVTDEKGNEAISAAGRLTVSAETKPERPDGYNPGDINGDGMIDVSDAVLLARFVAEDASAKITRTGVMNADVDGNGNADLQDVAMILMFIAKKIKAFPAA